jgi:N-glycosylase/DNA lyase
MQLIRPMRLLSPNEEIVPGVQWGRPEDIFSPAFWASIAASTDSRHGFENREGDLRREVCFCLLGGFGIKAEINRAAYVQLANAGMLEERRRPTTRDIEKILRAPIFVEDRALHYRFPHQKAKRLAATLRLFEDEPNPPVDNPLELRRWLLQAPGIGMKTASWIVRNHLGTDLVAILDIHIIRACQLMSLFDYQIRLPRDYEKLERKFLDFAQALGVRASLLDAVIWREMRGIHRLLSS